MVTDPGLTFGLGLGFGFWPQFWRPNSGHPSGVALLVCLRPMPGFESASFLPAEAVLLSLAFLIRSRPVYGSWLVE